MADWVASRSGATAARGFHFQDAVGAWIALDIARGAIDGALVPEGLDDMQVEGADEATVQIKSRVMRRGPFRPTEAGGHIVDAWLADSGRTTPSPRVWVVLENGVNSTEKLSSTDRGLKDCLITDSPLYRAIFAAAAGRLTPDQVEDYLDRTAVLTLTWSDLDRLTDELLTEITSTPAAGRTLLARGLRVEIAEGTDNNATPDPSQRFRLDRSSILRLIHHAAEQIDVTNLEEALRTGVCASFDRSVGANSGDRFYEGESTQPGHVADGLVVIRRDLVSEVLAGLDEGAVVILTGPSGVGKSAVLWTIPDALPGIAWFRVQRLNGPEDANLLLRLARSHGASAAHPVGFLVDGAGTRALSGWEHLRAAAAAQPGVVLVATARKEDLIVLGGLADTRTVEVTLDETGAEAIFAGLQRRRATTAAHWRQAFEESEGLTLEYTYLLTQGRRLADVVADQVQRRVVEDRGDELDLLALVAVADQWSTSLGLDRVRESIGTDDHRLRRAISSLAEEHLLVEANGALTGLHPVRSAAIATSIHGTPPPTLASTTATLLRLIDDDQIPRFIVGVLRDEPSLVDVVLDVGSENTHSARRLAAFLQGLRVEDSARAVREWITIMQTVGVPRSIQLPVAMYRIANLDFSDLSHVVREDVQESLRQFADVHSSDLRDRLAALVGSGRLSALVFDSTVEDSNFLIATLGGSSVQLEVPERSSELITWLSAAPLDDVANVMAALRHQSHELQAELIARLGGEDGVLERVRSERPWLLGLHVREGTDGPIGFARLLHVEDLGEPRERCLELARVLLRLLPSIVATDIEVLLPGGQRMEIGGHVHGISGLLRRYDHDQTEQAWNQAQIGVVQRLVGAPDTIRLSAASPIVCDLAEVVREAGSRWLRAEPFKRRDLQLRQAIHRLYEAAEDLPPALRAPDINLQAISSSSTLSTSDSLSNGTTQAARLLLRIAEEDNHALLAAYARDHVLKPLRQALDEPWHLVADGPRVIDALNDLASDVKRIHDVLVARAFGGLDSTQTEKTARRGAARFALARCATEANGIIAQLANVRSEEVLAAVNAAVPNHPVNILVEETDGFYEFVLLVDGPPLFEWAGMEESITSLLKAQRRPTESFVVIPLRRGRRVADTGVRVMTDALPITNLGKWKSRLPDPHPTVLAPKIAVATTALQVLSALADLPQDQREHPEVSRVASEASDNLSDAAAALREHDDEFVHYVLAEMLNVAERVQAELDGERPSQTFAEAVAMGLLGTPTEEWALVLGLWVCAVEWEIEPDSVRRLLEW